MTDRDEQFEARLRARPLPGLSDGARHRLLADLASVAPRQTLWRTIMTPRYAAACVAALLCVAAIAGATIFAHRMRGNADSDNASQRADFPVVAPGPSANREIVASKPRPADAKSIPAANLSGGDQVVAHKPSGSDTPMSKTASLAEIVAEPGVVVAVATFVDSAPAESKWEGRYPETALRFRVDRFLKGKLDRKIITDCYPDPPIGKPTDEFVRKGEKYVLVLQPEFIAGGRYAMILPIKREAEILATLAARRGNP